MPERGEWVDLEPISKPVLHELPPLEVEGEAFGWPPDTVAMWEAWRQDPVTAQWSPADVAFAFDTIKLHAQMTSSNAAEIRLRMDRLGLTPKGKRDLRWRIAPVEAEVVQIRKRKLPQTRRLRAV